jgi:hypothetical protein
MQGALTINKERPESGISASVRSRVYDIRGNGRIYRIKTPNGPYYKFVSDSVPDMIAYIKPEDIEFVEGFPQIDMLDNAPWLEDNTSETQRFINAKQNAIQKKILNSQAYQRYSSLASKPGGPNNGNNTLYGFPGLTYKPGPFFKVNNSTTLRQHAKQLEKEGAGALFKRKPKSWFSFSGGKKSRKTRRAPTKKRQTRKRK